MKAGAHIYINLAIISAVMVCFEIIATRISSVIFVYNYAYIVLSLAILGLGCGGIFAYFKFKSNDEREAEKRFTVIFLALGASLFLFILAVTSFKFIVNPVVYFSFLFVPFFLAGIFYSLVFRLYSQNSFRVYAADLTGAALGAISAIGALEVFGGSDSVLLLMVIVCCCGVSFIRRRLKRKTLIPLSILLPLIIIFVIYNTSDEILKPIPIGNFPEKDFHYVYTDPAIKHQIIDSRWSIYGRADLVQYSHQDLVRQMFIDGAAGTQMFHFNGDKHNPSPILSTLLVRYSTAIPFLFLEKSEKNSMLVIGPGGGKEVLTGLLAGVDDIIGVEINPDFVQIVKDQKDFNGGIYTEFPNIHILVKEGRHFMKQTDRAFDLIVMALPSTEQLQNIGPYAMSENYLLTVEAIQDYLSKLTSEGRLVLTLHNSFELTRLIVSTICAFERMGVMSQEAINHFMIIEQKFAPTIVIKKSPFTRDEIDRYSIVKKSLPEELPAVTYLPFQRDQKRMPSEVDRLLTEIANKNVTLEDYINQSPFNIAPCFDDSPFFYKIKKGIPADVRNLLITVLMINILVIVIPFFLIKQKPSTLMLPVLYFVCLGIGFMIIEISLFQKLVLYLGSPTISLAILLSSLLVSMGIGSYAGHRIYAANHLQRIHAVSLSIIITGSVIFFLSQYLLDIFLRHTLLLRIIISVVLILPFGFLLGVLFPSCLLLLRARQLSNYIPWMYGINSTMTVLGSILAVLISMTHGFSVSFFAGLIFYAIIFIFTRAHVKALH